MKRPHFGGISIFFAFLGFLGVRALVFFSGTPKRPKIPKNQVWGPVEAVPAKFSGDRVMPKIPVRARAGGGEYA